MLIGAHVSTSGGLLRAVERSIEIGAECIQIFVSSPRMWATRPCSDEEAQAFKLSSYNAKLGPTLIHGKYLLGLGSPDEELVARSIVALTADIKIADKIGAIGLVFHPSSHKGQGFEKSLPVFCDAIKRVLDSASDNIQLMLETSAGSGNHIGSKFEELGIIIQKVQDKRLKVCLDTQHVWAAGYNISTVETQELTMREFDNTIGIENLSVLHINDSKKPLASGVDRHENIGEGFIGYQGFLNFFTNPVFKDMPCYLEVPGFNGKGPDKENVDILKNIREKKQLPTGFC